MRSVACFLGPGWNAFKQRMAVLIIESWIKPTDGYRIFPSFVYNNCMDTKLFSMYLFSSDPSAMLQSVLRVCIRDRTVLHRIQFNLHCVLSSGCWSKVAIVISVVSEYVYIYALSNHVRSIVNWIRALCERLNFTRSSFFCRRWLCFRIYVLASLPPRKTEIVDIIKGLQ